jgi:DNA-binding CsgD family transcriptional regulator
MTDLTAREDQVLRLAIQGLSNDEIASRLDISRRTVEAHMHTLFRKTGVTRRSQLVGVTAPESASESADRDRLERYDVVLRQLVDRHLALFEERVEITFVVGATDGADRVTERRWTTPKPYLVYRTSRPVVGPDWEAGLDPVRLELDSAVPGRDIEATALPVTESDGRPLAVVLFRPGLAEETEWTLTYRSEGLWDPLRATGADRLGWSTATSESGRGHRPTVTDMAIRFVFPPGWDGIGLSERDGVGIASEPLRLASGQQEVGWRDPDPTAAKYEFRVAGSPPR